MARYKSKRGVRKEHTRNSKFRGAHRGSVHSGYRHIWDYRGVWDETKLKPGLWKFRFRASKGKKSKSYGSFGKGTTGAWEIKGRQYIVKTGKGKYQTDFIGYKKPLRFYIKRGRNGNRNKKY